MKFYCSIVLLSIVSLVHASNTSRDLKIASWNMQYFSADNYVSLHPQSTQPRTNSERDEYRNIIEFIDADIIALQEVSGERALELFSDNYEVIFSKQADGQMNNNNSIHNAFLIRHSLKENIINSFTLEKSIILYKEKDPSTGEKIERASRAFVGLRLLLDKQPLTILNVHLKHSCKSMTFNGSGCRVVRSQLDVINNFLREEFKKSFNSRIWLVGDMNLVLTKDKQWPSFSEKLFEPSWHTESWPKYSSPVCQTSERNKFIDYLVCVSQSSNGCKGSDFREYDYSQNSMAWGLQMSDHCPISVINR
ncbi:endonuclease/exonuclease/phosphatase family protein [Vibrio cyclitrophicus]